MTWQNSTTAKLHLIKTVLVSGLSILAIITLPGIAFSGDGPNTLPFDDDFEAYADGTPLDTGTNGWYASCSSVIVVSNTALTPDGSTNSALIATDCTLSNRFDTIPVTNVWLQMDVRPTFYDSTNPPVVDALQATMLYIDSNGNFVVHNGAPSPDTTNSVNWITLTNVTVNTNGTTWVTIGIYEDFIRKKWDLYADGTLVTNNIWFINQALTNFTGFDVYNGASSSYVDNVYVSASNRTVGTIGLSTTTLAFEAVYTTSPSNQSLPVIMTNLGQAAFTYSNAVTYGSGADWFTFTPLMGELAGGAIQTFTGEVSTAGMTVGVYVATNTMTSPEGDAENAPQTIVATLTVGKAAATVHLGDLIQTYDGTARNVSTSTTPAGLGLILTYDGNPWAPTNAGTYEVVGTITDPNWQGSSMATLTVNQASALVHLGNLTQTYDGTARNVSTSTTPAGLGLILTYDGNPWAPTNAGTYAVTGTVVDINYQGSSSATLTVNKANQTITFPAIPPQKTNNVVRLSASASSGMEVSFAIGSGPGTLTGGTNLTFTGPGDVSVVASQAGDLNWNLTNLTRIVKVYALSATNGPYTGGNLLTITNGTLGSGSDITNLLVGSNMATINTQGVNWVVITVPPASTSGVHSIIIHSTTAGKTVFADAYSYTLPGTIDTVLPTSGSYLGVYPVLISGTNLGNGSDITNVTLCGCNALLIVSQSVTQVKIIAGVSTGGLGNVAVYSPTYGVTVKPNAFWYSVPPQDVAATDGEYTNMIRVTWSASPGATGYEIWRNTYNSTTYATRIGETSVLVFDDLTTAYGREYYYWVKATNSLGTSDFSLSDSGWRRPPAPGKLSFKVAAYEVNENAGSIQLAVSRSMGSDYNATVIYTTKDGTATAGVDYAASSGTLSWGDHDTADKTFTISVLNRAGKQDDRTFSVELSDAYNASITAPAASAVTIHDMWPPMASGVTASKGTYPDKVLVYWDYVATYFSAYFKVWRATENDVSKASWIATCSATFYLDTSTGTDIPYYYWIQTFNSAGTNDSSIPDFGYCGTTANLASPSGLQASDGSYTDRIRITWQPVSAATQYEIWRSTQNDRLTASLVATLTGTTYDDAAVAQGIRYYYWLKAKSLHRDGNFSESEAGWSLLSAPSGASASNRTSPYHIRVNWHSVVNASWYEIWREKIPGGGSEGGALEMITQTSALYFDDYFTQSGVYYRYQVKACNEVCSSLDYGEATGSRQVSAAVPTALFAISDYDGDKRSDLALFNSMSGSFDVLCSQLGRRTFAPNTAPGTGVIADYDGDGTADPTAYRQNSGTWSVMLSCLNYSPVIRGNFGQTNDTPLGADFDGDGLTDLSLYNETSGLLSIGLSNKGAFDIIISGYISAPGYKFISADFDGDGLADPTVYSKSAGRVLIWLSGSGYSCVAWAFGGPDFSMHAADFDGDNLDDPVLYKETSDAAGSWTIWLSRFGYAPAMLALGGAGFTPVIADYDGDGLADPAVYRATDGQWLIMFSASSYAVVAETFGGSAYQPACR